MSDAIVYGLRTCNADMTSRGGFAWPREGWVEAPDWDPSPECGGGLHFLRNGEGDADLLSHDADAVWQVIMSYESETVDIDNTKSKAKRCNVLLSGPWHEATAKLRSLVGSDKRIPYVCETAGDRSVQTAGDRSVQTAGDRSVQTAGHWSSQTAGRRSAQTAGRRSVQTAGDWSSQTAGDWSSQTAGDRSVQTAGHWSSQTAGHWSSQTAGDRSVQTAGYYSVQTAGDRSVQTAGGGSVLICRWCDVTTGHFRISVAIVGNGGTLKPNTPYRVSKGVWTEVTPETGDAS